MGGKTLSIRLRNHVPTRCKVRKTRRPFKKAGSYATKGGGWSWSQTRISIFEIKPSQRFPISQSSGKLGAPRFESSQQFAICDNTGELGAPRFVIRWLSIGNGSCSIRHR